MIQQMHFWVFTRERIASRDSNRYLYTHVHRMTVHTSQKVAVSQMSITG